MDSRKSDCRIRRSSVPKKDSQDLFKAHWLEAATSLHLPHNVIPIKHQLPYAVTPKLNDIRNEPRRYTASPHLPRNIKAANLENQRRTV